VVSERAQDCSRAVLVRVGRDLVSCIFSRSDVRGAWFQRNRPLPARIGRFRAYQLVDECVPVCVLFVALQVNHVLRFQRLRPAPLAGGVCEAGVLRLVLHRVGPWVRAPRVRVPSAPQHLCALPLGCSQKHCAMDSALLRAQLAAAPHSVGGWERGQSGTGHWMVQATARVADSSGSVGAGSRKTSTQVRASTSLTRWRSLTSPSSEQRGQRLLLQHAAVEASRKEME